MTTVVVCMLTTMRMQGARRAGVLALLVGVLLTLSGCGKASVALTIHADDTVTMVASLSISTQLLAAAGANIDAVVDSALPKGWPVTTREHFTDGDQTGVRITTASVPLSSVAVGTARIQHVKHVYVMNGVLDTSAARTVDGQTGTFSVAVTFPGDIHDTNGKRVGRTVTWTGQTGSTLQLRAIADDGYYYKLGAQIGTFAVEGGALAVLVAIAVIAIRDRRRPALPRFAGPAPMASPVLPRAQWTGPASWTPGSDPLERGAQQPPPGQDRARGW